MASGLEEELNNYESVKAISDYLLLQVPNKPSVGIICGSGLGGLADQVENPVTFEYHRIPNFPVSTVVGHEGKLVFGELCGKYVVCMKGRFHFYEGYSPKKLTTPVRVMRLMGVETLIVTNAAGGLNESFTAGDVMIIKDHINMVGMVGMHPLRGHNDTEFGPRFPAMSTAYDSQLRQLAAECVTELRMESFVRSGVYVCLSGPSYETPAECRMIKMLGGDAVGMSTAPEVVVAKHCGMKVLGLSLITNMTIMDVDTPHEETSHKEVLEIGRQRAQDIEQLVKRILSKMTTS